MKAENLSAEITKQQSMARSIKAYHQHGEKAAANKRENTTSSVNDPISKHDSMKVA